jgi:hypothetical protein
MEQNEQSTENATTNEQSAVTGAENSTDKTATSGGNGVVTFPQATIKIEGQEFELEAALAQDDKLLKTILQPHFASVENANITRDVKEGKLTVTIVKKAQHKG